MSLLKWPVLYKITNLTQSKQILRYYLQLYQTRIDARRLAGRNENKTVVVMFGDSRAKSWPTPLNLSAFEFINRGISNDTSAQIQWRFNKHVSPLSPDIVIVQAGINDLRTISISRQDKADVIADCKRNIQQIIKQLITIEAAVILTTIFPIGRQAPAHAGPFWLPDVAEAVKEINHYLRTLNHSQVIVFDSYLFLANEQGFMQSRYAQDSLHINSIGYNLLNFKLTSVLLQSVSLKA